jgi:hypothetical protein
MRETHAREGVGRMQRRAPRSAPRIPYRDRVGAPDLQTSNAQLLDDAAGQGFNVASRVLLDRCDNDALDLGLLC